MEVLLYYSDALIPDEGRPRHDGWRYDVIAAHIESRSGRRPLIVRRRPNDIQGGLARFMRLTGIDPLALDERERAEILDGEA